MDTLYQTLSLLDPYGPPRLRMVMLQAPEVKIPSNVLQIVANRILEEAAFKGGEFDLFEEVFDNDYEYDFCVSGTIRYGKPDPIYGREPESLCLDCDSYCVAYDGDCEPHPTDFNEEELESLIV